MEGNRKSEEVHCRDMIVYYAQRAGYSHPEIAAFFNRSSHSTTVTMMKRARNRLAEREGTWAEVIALLKEMTDEQRQYFINSIQKKARYEYPKRKIPYGTPVKATRPDSA